MTKFMGFLALGLLAACGGRETKPAMMLTKEKLTALIIEMYLAEAKMDATSLPRDSTIRFFIPQEKQILKKLGVSDSTLKITYDYYLQHPKEFEEVYDAVIDSLNLREQQIK
ncbi:MAG: DUF4296 domain-containing protein [Flammeovirgaceae bacterium]